MQRWHGWFAGLARWPGLCRVRMVAHSGEHSRRVRTVVVGIRKKNLFQNGRGRIAHKPYGGKTGMAMIKYPPYKKNNSRKNTLLYPGFTSVSLDR